MIPAISAANAPGNAPINRIKAVFWLPLVGYWLLAILMAGHTQPPWIVMILGCPLVLMAFANTRRARQRTTRLTSSRGGDPAGSAR
jgi:hypothetical protein